MFFKNKLANGANVGGLIFLIAVLFILYTLVLPPCDKCQLLGEDCSNVCEGELGSKILLKESIGEVGVESKDEIIHVLDSADLFIKTEPNLRILSNSLEIKNALFGQTNQKLEFELDDLENLNEISLVFAVLEAKGNLIISLNEREIFNQKLIKNKIETINLPKEYLEEKNKLWLEVSNPGFAFWSTNKYRLKDVNLKEFFELIHSSESLEFSVSSSERNSLSSSNLHFYVYCKEESEQSDILKVHLNDNIVFNQYVPCVNEEHDLELEKNYFLSGVNDLEFSVSGGNYLISDIEISNEVGGEVYPSYIFYIRNDVYEGHGQYYLTLDMSGDEKKAEIILNDEILNLNTVNNFKQFDISNEIKRGNNFIEVKPISSFEINEIKIEYE